MANRDETVPARVPGERLLHAPGPTHIPAKVLNAMHRQPMDHADPRLDAVIASCESRLRRLLKTSAAELFLYAANGHGVWEAVTENLLAPGEAALIPATGHFSEQWALQLERCWQFLAACSNRIVAALIFVATMVAAIMIIPLR